MNLARIHSFILTAIVFSMPVNSNVVPPLIILSVICWLLEYRLIGLGLRELAANKSVLVLAVFYLVYLFGVIYSENRTDVGQILETKLSLLIFPLVLSTRIEAIRNNLYRYLRAFIYGCLFSALVCFIWALYCYLKPVYVNIDGIDYDLGASYFYYARLSAFLHPSYISMYFNFALILIYYLISIGEIKINWKWITAAFILTVFVLLFSSKAGWLGLFSITLFVGINLIRKKAFLLVLVILAMVSTLFYFLNMSAPKYSQRITPAAESMVKSGSAEDLKKSNDGTASRILVWQVSLEIIKENFLFGTGTGDAKPTMLEKYKEKGMTTEVEHKLNSHDQYLNTFVAIGFIGFACLIFCLLVPVYFSVRYREILFGLFACLVGLNFLFESMLETQSGVMFFALFHTMLSYYYLNRKPGE